MAGTMSSVSPVGSIATSPCRIMLCASPSPKPPGVWYGLSERVWFWTATVSVPPVVGSPLHASDTVALGSDDAVDSPDFESLEHAAMDSDSETSATAGMA